MRDFFIGWHERFQPLGPALKTPRIEVEEKAPLSDFETRSYDHPSCTGGNAPSLSPQALVPSPAGQVFKVGDRVKAGEYGLGTITEVMKGIRGGDAHYVKFDTYRDCLGHDWSVFYADCLEHISQPSDTQQWVEWKGGDCPLPKGTNVVVRYRCGKESCAVRAGLNEPSPIQEDAGPAFWLHEASPFDIVAYRVVQ